MNNTDPVKHPTIWDTYIASRSSVTKSISMFAEVIIFSGILYNIFPS
jgi:hypothetical protein